MTELTLHTQHQLISQLKTKLEQQFNASVEEIETHISHLLLVGDQVFKFKKPVNFGFLDFSTLEKRYFYCAEELRLNRRFAPDLYEAIIPIVGTVEHPELIPEADHNPQHKTHENQEKIIEYAVKMRRFDQNSLFDRLLQQEQLTTTDIDTLADKLATFHQNIDFAAPDTPFGDSETVFTAALNNFRQIRPLLPHIPDANENVLQNLEQWTQTQLQTLRPLVEQRKQGGFVRECHGDLHLRNIARIDGETTLFDGIEFNEPFRWIDVMSELAFLLMDIEFRNHPQFANRLLNHYLQQTSDYGGLPLLPFYKIYRALVRAKVAALQIAEPEHDPAANPSLTEEFNAHIALAQQYANQQINSHPFLCITHGFSGSGKSVAAAQLAEQTGALQIRADIERKRLFPENRGNAQNQQLDAGRYSSEATERTYVHLLETAKTLLQNGFSVILDATWLNLAQRQAAQKLTEAFSQDFNIQFRILDLRCETEELEQRILARQTTGKDASEATLKVLHHQIETAEPLTETEQQWVVQIFADTDVMAAFSNHTFAIQC